MKRKIHYILLIVVLLIIFVPKVKAINSIYEYRDNFVLISKFSVPFGASSSSKIEGFKSESATTDILTTDYEHLCTNNKGVIDAVRIISYVILIVKWAAPLMIIIFGMVDFGKAMISDDENALAKAAKSLFRRVIAGVIIFFVPTLLNTIIKSVESFLGYNDATTFGACTRCILDLNECKSNVSSNGETYQGSGSQKEEGSFNGGGRNF